MDIAKFRADQPEFADTAMYDNAMIARHARIAEARISQKRFGDSYVDAVQLYVAHCLVIGARNKRAADAGGFPGQVTGTQTSKRLGSASVSYAQQAQGSRPLDIGNFELTNYGQQYLELVSLFGAGVLHVP